MARGWSESVASARTLACSATAHPRRIGAAPSVAVGHPEEEGGRAPDTVREAFDLTETLKRFYRFDTVESAVRSYM